MFCRDDKDYAGCAVVGIMNQKGERFSGNDIIKSIACMHDRSNGLGGGFAAYGIYPDYKDFFAFHMMYQSAECKSKGEEFLKSKFNVIKAEKIPTRKTPSIKNEPLLWRYFLEVGKCKPDDISEEDYIVDMVMQINSCIDGVFVSSSGKNMGVFKGVGFPEDIGEFFKLEDYKGYTWLSHGRFPTNTQGWWGGAHPFNLLNWSVVHNGELSSYGTNKRYLEMYGYICTLMTDTEVVAYTMDLLMRKHNLPLNLAASVIAAPLWSEIDRMKEDDRELYTRLRQTYSPILLNGPFSFIIADNNRMIGITDRIRLRPLVAATKNEWFYISTEESAIRLISPELDKVWQPRGGEPIVGKLEREA